jgi:hypothetical protein
MWERRVLLALLSLFLREWLPESGCIGIGGVGVTMPAWSSLEETISEMDDQGIGVRVPHLSAPEVYFKDRGLSKTLAVMTNETS